MVVDKGDVLRSSRYVALFLINSLDFELTGQDYNRYLKVVESRLVPLLENGVLGHGKPLGLSHYGSVHSRLTSSSALIAWHG